MKVATTHAKHAALQQQPIALNVTLPNSEQSLLLTSHVPVTLDTTTVELVSALRATIHVQHAQMLRDATHVQYCPFERWQHRRVLVMRDILTMG